MTKQMKRHGGLYFYEGRCYALSVQQCLLRYCMLEGKSIVTTSNADGVSYYFEGGDLAIPYTSELFEFMQHQLSVSFVHCWYHRNPGQMLTRAIDTAGDQLIEEFGIREFQLTRQRAADHDERHMAYLASLPTALPPKMPKIRLVK